MEKKNFLFNPKLYLMISGGIIVVAILLSIFGLGMNMGIDFAGGSMLTYDVGETVDVSIVEAALKEAGVKEFQVGRAGENQDQLEVRIKDMGAEVDDMRVVFEEKLAETYADLTFITIDTVGAVAGRDLIANAIYSCLIVFVALLIYISIRFDVYSGMAALFALAHDILIMCAFMVFARGAYQINSPFIAALLTIIGYSINNTIIVFDRIRENSQLLNYKVQPRAVLVADSVRSTLTRTVNTTITTLLTLVVLYILGVDSIKEFTFPLIIGMLAGVYSSVLISGQVWASWMDKGTFDFVYKLFGKKTKKA